MDLRNEIQKAIDATDAFLKTLEEIAKEKGFSIDTKRHYNEEIAVLDYLEKYYKLNPAIITFNPYNFHQHMYYRKSSPNEYNKYTLEEFTREEIDFVRRAIPIDYLEVRNGRFQLKLHYFREYDFRVAFKHVTGSAFDNREFTLQKNNKAIIPLSSDEATKIKDYFTKHIYKKGEKQ